MARPFFLYPGGSAGIALLLLRLSTALPPALLVARAGTRSWLCAPPLVILVAALLLGIRTRAAALACAALPLLLLFLAGDHAIGRQAMALLDAVALALLGPGAVSIDARLYGRRVLSPPGDTRL